MTERKSKISGRKELPNSREWTEVGRELLPESTMIFRECNRHTLTYAQMLYRLVETRVSGKRRYFRYREERTNPFFLIDHPEMHLAFEVAGPALTEIEKAITAEESKTKKPSRRH